MNRFRKEDYQLRQLKQSDCWNVLTWRNQRHVRSVMYNGHEIAGSEHRAWFSRVITQSDASYLILEHAGTPEAFVSFTSIDEKNRKCFWGYYLISSQHVPGTGSVMAWFSLDWCFRILKMRKLCCESLATNFRACALYRKFGFTQEAMFRAHVFKDGLAHDVNGFSLLSEEWGKLEKKLAEKLFM